MKLSSTTTTAPTTGGSDGVAGFMTSFGTMAMMLFSTVTTLTPTTTTALSFDTSSVGNNDLAGDMLSFVARTYVPYGPDLLANPPQSPSDQPWTGLGYGLGATEHWAFDTKEKYVYSQSEAPGGQFITVLDFGASDDGTGVVSEFSFDVSDRGEIRDLVVCSERGWLFVSLTDANKVFMYETVKRGSPGVPALVKEIQAGTSPDALKLSNDCTYLAVANQNEGLDITTQGSVNLVSDFESETPTVREVSLADFTEEEMLARDVHLPLTLAMLQYWQGAGTLALEDFTLNFLIENWNPAIALDPEFMAFNNDGSQLYLNLQDNSAVVRIDTESGTALAIDGYGIKEFTSGDGIDIVVDGGCTRRITSACVAMGRTPDGVATVEVDGVDYLLTADEGSDYDLDAYEEKVAAQVFFSGDLVGFTTGATLQECSANFAADCDTNTVSGGWCAGELEVTLGTAAVDYSDTSAPVVNKLVGFGGRGLSIFEIPTAAGTRIRNVWDSKSDFEVKTCESFPWAANALQDEEFAPSCALDTIDVCPAWELFPGDQEDFNDRNIPPPSGSGCEDGGDGNPGACPMSETVDAKALEDGPGVEAVVVGVACGRLVAVACGENNAICLLYDITDIENPVFKKVFSLSPASENLNPGVAYDRGELGDMDSETILFLNAEDSPTGNTGIMFGGAISGTLSFYEFECLDPTDPPGSSAIHQGILGTALVSVSAFVAGLWMI